MLKSFEKQTHKVTDYEEKTILPLLVNGLKKKIGKENSITNSKICKSLTSKGFIITEARVRKLIFLIRKEGLVPRLIASSKGYWVTNDINEIQNWISSLKSRISAMQETLDYAIKIKIQTENEKE